MKRFRAVLLLLAITSFGAASRAQDEPKPQAPAPQIARAAMPTGAISLRWQLLPPGAYRTPLALHLFCVPKGHSKEREQMFGEKQTGPITRETISQGPSIEPSPFWFDLWTKTDANTTGASTWQRVNRVKFVQTKDAQEIRLRWVDPSKKTMPMLLMHFGFTHWHEWETFTFADGWAKAPYARQFYWGGENEYYNEVRFDKTQNGRMIVETTDGEPGKVTKGVYRWNGREWLNSADKYFLIAATFKTRAEAQAWSERKGWGEVLHSNDYSKLRAGYYIVVLDRFRALKDANERAKLVGQDERNSDFKLYVRRAL